MGLYNASKGKRLRDREIFRRLGADDIRYILDAAKHEDNLYGTGSFYRTFVGSICFGGSKSFQNALWCAEMEGDICGPYAEVDLEG